MTKEEFMEIVEEMYDRSKALADTNDEDKMVGALIRLAKGAKEEDVAAMMELSILTKVLETYGD